MHDVISRQAAIDAIVAWAKDTNEMPDGDDCIMIIGDLPSAQPEPSEITDEQAILHLQSTGWMQRHDKEMYESGLREQLADDSGSYDSLIPCEDTISRTAAIDVVKRLMGDYELSRTVQTGLHILPSAQPDGIPLEWIDKHLEWLDNCDNDFAQLAKVGIRAMVELWKKDRI